MNTYIIVDLHNLFHRCKHVTRGDVDLKTGMAVHIMLSSLRKMWQKFEGSHVVVCLEGRSWRRDFYEPYKKTRRTQAQLRTPKEQEEDELFLEALNEFTEFLQKKTNVTILHNKILEADDLVAGWIDNHPDDFHVILSGDSDFLQLISNNVVMYDGVKNETVTINGYWDDKGEPIPNKKTGKQKQPRDPEYELFLKTIRGDATDGIFSAYPKVRENKIQQAFEDRHNKGYMWNNIMLQEWHDENGYKHRVLDDYKRNKQLIDLRAQPEEIRQLLDETIKECCAKKGIKQVGVWFIKFAEEWDLQRLSKEAQTVAPILQADYPGA